MFIALSACRHTRTHSYTLTHTTHTCTFFLSGLSFGRGSEDVFIIMMKKTMSSFSRTPVSLSQNWICPSEGGVSAWNHLGVPNGREWLPPGGVAATQKCRAMPRVTEQAGGHFVCKQALGPSSVAIPPLLGFPRTPTRGRADGLLSCSC